MGAIYIDPAVNRATVNEDECVECHTCYRGMSKEALPSRPVRAVRGFLKLLRVRFDPEPDVCPTAALTPQDLVWPRTVRRAFSDPLVPHESTGVDGRGTEEVKTNDVTGRVGEGEAGFTVEFGRPGVGVRFREVERMATALAALGVEFEPKNPVYALMSDPVKGTLRADVVDEKVLSAILELKTTLAQVPGVLRCARALAPELETIVAIGVSTRCDSEGGDRLEALLRAEGLPAFRGKTNLGLGRRGSERHAG
jgi:hypothetical protein